jgi:hypothetical protein
MTDLITGIVVFFASIMILWVFTLIFQVNIFQSSTVKNSVGTYPQTANVLTSSSGFFTGLNTVFAFAYIFFAFGAIIAAAFTESNPVFAALGFVVLPIELLLSFGFHDAFFSMIGNSAFAPLTAAYPMVALTFQYLPIGTFVLAIIVLAVTFGK